MLALQQRFNLKDEDLEFQVNDRRPSKYRFRELEPQPQAVAPDLARGGAAEAPCHASRRAKYPQHAWTIEFQFDQTINGRKLKFLE
jgi:hypothetical protein